MKFAILVFLKQHTVLLDQSFKLACHQFMFIQILLVTVQINLIFTW